MDPGSAEKQAEVERLDRWLAHIDEAMSNGGDVAKLVDQGRRLLDMRRELVALDVDGAASPQPAARASFIVDQAILDDEIMDGIRQRNTESEY